MVEILLESIAICGSNLSLKVLSSFLFFPRFRLFLLCRFEHQHAHAAQARSQRQQPARAERRQAGAEQASAAAGCACSARGAHALLALAAVFLFLYFSISFFTKIYFCFRNLQEYTPAAPLLGGRDLVAPLRSGRGFSVKIFAENLR